MTRLVRRASLLVALCLFAAVAFLGVSGWSRPRRIFLP
jgi:hypothetical protein